MLRSVFEHRADIPPTALEEGSAVEVVSVHHDLMVVFTPDCDLLWDFDVRFPTEDARKNLGPPASDAESHSRSVQHVLLCDAYEGVEMKDRLPGSDVRRRARGNQDERYHCFPDASIGASRESDGDEEPRLPETYLDFKKALALPTALLYEGLRVEGIERVALIPAPFSHDLIHRFYSFQSRVAVPEW